MRQATHRVSGERFAIKCVHKLRMIVPHMKEIPPYRLEEGILRIVSALRSEYVKFVVQIPLLLM